MRKDFIPGCAGRGLDLDLRVRPAPVAPAPAGILGFFETPCVFADGLKMRPRQVCDLFKPQFCRNLKNGTRRNMGFFKTDYFLQELAKWDKDKSEIFQIPFVVGI